MSDDCPCLPGPVARRLASGVETPPTEGIVDDPMVDLPGGTFRMGSDDDDARVEDGEGPARYVTVDPFAVDVYAVTNASFDRFVDATGYRTEAEQYGWSYVFQGLVPKNRRRRLARDRRIKEVPWWYAVKGATWRKPEGPGSSIRNRLDHPVVQVSWNDANTYARWAGKRLPTEAEWEYAARGGLEGQRFPWGNELLDRGAHRMNIWQGKFPGINTRDDGFYATAPVDTFEANGYGLFNSVGNVWEWCQDWYSADRHRSNVATSNPRGPEAGDRKSLRGGSYLCHASYCNRYRVAARFSNTPDSSTGHAGFRCVRSVSA